MIPALPGLPEFQAVGIPESKSLGTALLVVPGVVTTQVTNSRALEAAQMAEDMRAAFAYSKAANRRSKAVARAKGRQAQRIAERR